MNQLNLEEYLSNPWLARTLPFTENEMMDLDPELILSVYSTIMQAIREDLPIIQVSEKETALKKYTDGPIVERGLNPIDFRILFELVRKRDPVIKSHLYLVSKSSSSLIYQLSPAEAWSS